MIVMKFGGTSLRDAAALRTVATLVRARLSLQPVLVVSAHAGVTDMLVELAEAAVAAVVDLEPLKAKHRAIREELGLREDLHSELFDELADLCRGIRLVGELSPRSRDALYSFGERMSVRSVAAALSAAGIEASACNSYDVGVRSDSKFGGAQLLPDDGHIQAALAQVRGIPVVTGFIAKDEAGNLSTIGRNGSDLSAAFIGNAIDAAEIQIWTDVDGVLTSDPRIVEDARPIPRMSFDEAAELASQGGKVLHPASLAPAMAKSIPVRVLNTHRPDSPGTVILPQVEEEGVLVRCIAHKRHVTLVDVETSAMLGQAGFLAQLFDVTARHHISVDMISTSEVSVSFTLDHSAGLEAAEEELRELAQVEIEHGLAQICVVGHGIRNRMGVPARIFEPLRKAGIEVRMISLGAMKVNVSLVVGGDDVERAVQVLHDEFFTGSTTP
ncbi:MAG: aspartate kinase [Planctomycetota bacterium]|nr:MAG: aspartate kinase [Planctomycetota bacterium]